MFLDTVARTRTDTEGQRMFCMCSIVNLRDVYTLDSRLAKDLQTKKTAYRALKPEIAWISLLLNPALTPKLPEGMIHCC